MFLEFLCLCPFLLFQFFWWWSQLPFNFDPLKWNQNCHLQRSYLGRGYFQTGCWIRDSRFLSDQSLKRFNDFRPEYDLWRVLCPGLIEGPVFCYKERDPGFWSFTCNFYLCSSYKLPSLFLDQCKAQPWSFPPYCLLEHRKSDLVYSSLQICRYLRRRASWNSFDPWTTTSL